MSVGGDLRMMYCQGWGPQDDVMSAGEGLRKERAHHATQKSVQFKTDVIFISGIFPFTISRLRLTKSKRKHGK